MNYSQSKQWLDSLEIKMSGFGLETITRLCELGKLQPKNLPTVHVAGSNGKGSTCAFLESILREQGYKTAFYSSPHLIEPTERIKLNGKDISRQKFAKLATFFYEICQKNKVNATQFEITTAMAFKFFEEEKIDIFVAEVGLGGRLDATNILNGLVCVITSISLEHTQYLGNTIEKIASEKAGIIKNGSIVVALPENAGIETIRKIAIEKSARMSEPSFGKKEYTSRGNTFDLIDPAQILGLKTALIGEHQIENASLAAAAAIELREKGFEISESSIRKGLAKAFWPCRLEIVSHSPLTVLDAAHNPGGWETLFASLKLFDYERAAIVFAAMKDKDVSKFAELASGKNCELFLTQVENERCETAAGLREKIGFGKVVEDPAKAIRMARKAAGKKGILIVTGSIYMLGEIYGNF